MKKTAAFRDYVENSRRQLGRKLLEKAYTANKLAKMCKGDSRSRLYQIKYKYLSTAIEILPTTFYIDSQTGLDWGTILGIKSTEGFAFHIPAERLSSQARFHIINNERLIGGKRFGGEKKRRRQDFA